MNRLLVCTIFCLALSGCLQTVIPTTVISGDAAVFSLDQVRTALPQPIDAEPGSELVEFVVTSKRICRATYTADMTASELRCHGRTRADTPSPDFSMAGRVKGAAADLLEESR